MKPWQRILLANAAVLAGLAFSIKLLPGNTPFWPWATCALLWTVGLNILFSRRAVRFSTTAISKRDQKIILFIAALVIANLLLAWIIQRLR